MTRKLSTFPGGLHIADNKALSTDRPVGCPALPERLFVPLLQHIGETPTPLVAVGDRVLKGQMLAAPEGYVSAPVHAPSSGVVSAIEEHPVPHPSGLCAPCIVIDTDGKDEWVEHSGVEDYATLDPSVLRNLVRDAGIVGLGGAGFPAFIKLNPGPRTVVDTLILNGAECEPYITCDDMLMRERPEQVLAGARIMRHALQARHCVVAVEDNKPEALEALRNALAGDDIELVQVPTRYPTGGEKQLIKVLTGKEVPSQGLPIDIGIVCHNVATAAAVYRAVRRGEPLISRIVTVSGRGVAEPQNLEVAIGTPVQHLLDACGGVSAATKRLLVGGPMMGFDLRDRQAPLIKTSNCLLALTAAEGGDRGPTRPCIRCGECARACPASLLPQQLYWYARSKDFDKVQDYKLFDCIECGCCAYVCPSNLPLVQYYRYAKTEIWAQEREQKKADLARQRHEFRQERQEREKAERAARMKKKQAAVKPGADQPAAGAEDPKKAAIKAAMERAKAKKAAAATAPQNTDNLTPEQQQKITEADAARANARAATSDSESDQKD